MNAQDQIKLSSHQIGANIEADVERLLQEWSVDFVPKKAFVTTHGNVVTPDFWLPATGQRSPVTIECKNFGVAAKSTSDSRRRKAQEALYLLVQIRRYCSETAQSRIIVVTGVQGFTVDQIELLTPELQPDLHVLSVTNPKLSRELIDHNK
jgi:hypothetical protein